MSLLLNIAQATAQGPRERNEDFAGFVTPDANTMVIKGSLIALADGVSGGGYGREAAETTIRNLMSDYYATPDTWQTAHALRKLLQSVNGWLYAQSVTKHAAGGMSCTLSSLVCHGRRFTIAHVGDSRIYRLRSGMCECLTQDHVWDAPGMSHVLKRAVGLDQLLQVDIIEGDLQTGDRFLLCCDGVWSALSAKTVTTLLSADASADMLSQSLVDAALAADSQDNCTAVVVLIDGVSETANLSEWRADRELPLPENLSVGSCLDEFVIEAVLHESRETRLYLGRHQASNQLWVLKTLHESFANDPVASERLLMEEWMGRRLQSHYFPDIMPLPKRNFLYFAQRYYAGSDVGKMLASGHHFSSMDVVSHGMRLLKGIGALHRLDIVHRDIKPDNVHIDQQGKLRILDLGVASCALCQSLNIGAAERAGTPSYLAPELFAGVKANAQTDLYALGVTLYYMLTHQYPYGEIEPFQTPKFTEPKPPMRYVPSVPSWLENVLLKAVAKDPALRFETAEEFLFALEKGEFNRLERPRPTPLVKRDPVAFWQGAFMLSLVANLLLMYLLKVS